MKKFLLYNNESDSEPWGVFDESMLNEEYGFTDQDVEDILKLEILETLVLDMNNVVLRFWDY